jgi:outer membrane protein assembly factor BamB
MMLIYRTRAARAHQLAHRVAYNNGMSNPIFETAAYHATRKYRLGMPFWIWIVLAAGAAVALIQYLIPDQGLANGFTWPVIVLAILLCLVWFTLFSGFSWARRWLVCGVVVALVAGFAWAVRLDGLTGNIYPIVSWRWMPKPSDREPAAPPETTARANLEQSTPNDFPQFLGPNHDLSVPGVKLARDWSANPPKELWRQPIGAGWSGFAIVNGYAMTLEQRGPLELVTCYRVANGELVWSHATETRYEDALPGGPGPRSTPTIYQGRVYALGATGKLMCLDGATGTVVWQKDLLKEFGLSARDEHNLVLYGRSNSPLIVDDLVVVPAGGPNEQARWSLAAFHQDNGALVWKGGNHNISHSTPALATLGGKRQILIVNEDYVSGHDPKTGAELWQFDWPGTTIANANVSQAVPVEPDRVFVSKGYGGGAKLMQLIPNKDGTFEPKQVYHKPGNMKTKYTNVTIKDGYVYGLSDGYLECMELVSGRRMWREGHYAHGQILRADDLLLVMSEYGELTLVEATPDSPNNVLGKVQALTGVTWNNLALSGPYLLVRNAEEAVCYQLALESK